MSFPATLETISIGNEKLSLLVPDAASVREAYNNGEIPFPYWSRIWPSALALASFIHQHPAYFKDKTVLELGAGLGLPSLVAARVAKKVLCTDLMADAVNLANQSASLLEIKNFEARVIDWQQLSPAITADVLLLSDVNYEPKEFALLQTLVNCFLQHGATVIISTPQRLMAKEFVTPLLAFVRKKEEVEAVQNNTASTISIMVLKNE